MKGNQTILEPSDQATASSSKVAGKRVRAFSYGGQHVTSGVIDAHLADKSYWSAGPRDEAGYASQQTLYEDLGVELLDHSFEGFNTCIFACASFRLLHALDAQLLIIQMVRRAAGRAVSRFYTFIV